MDLDALGRRATAAGSVLDPAVQRRLLQYLVDLGATDDELVDAVDRLSVGELAVDLALRRGTPRPFGEVARDLGLAEEAAARYWRALGFPDPLRTPTAVADDAAAALRLLSASRDLFGEDATLTLARVVGTSTSRIAQAVLDVFRAQYEGPKLASGSTYDQLVRDYTNLARDLMPPFAEVVGAVLVRHLVVVAATAWTADAEGGAAQQDLAVGFADLTGYTALSRSLSPADLTRVIHAFEGAVTDATSHHGGRVVKLVGDGAMFSGGDAGRTCRVAADIVAASSESGVLPSVRVGVAAGWVVNLGGDLFGPVVNLAARLAAAAPDDAVLVDAEVRSRAEPAGFAFEPIGPQDLKGIGAPAAAFLLQSRSSG